MTLKVVAIVLFVVGLYLNTWHSAPLPFNHFAAFGRELGSNHAVHSFIGLVLMSAAAWLWMRAKRPRTSAA